MIGADVYLWGTKIGTVVQEDSAAIPVFQYASEYRRYGVDVAPVMMPLSGRKYSFPANSEEGFRRLPGLLADSLPDRFGNKLIKNYLNKTGRSEGDISLR